MDDKHNRPIGTKIRLATSQPWLILHLFISLEQSERVHGYDFVFGHYLFLKVLGSSLPRTLMHEEKYPSIFFAPNGGYHLFIHKY